MKCIDCGKETGELDICGSCADVRMAQEKWDKNEWVQNEKEYWEEYPQCFSCKRRVHENKIGECKFCKARLCSDCWNEHQNSHYGTAKTAPQEKLKIHKGNMHNRELYEEYIKSGLGMCWIKNAPCRYKQICEKMALELET